MSRTLLLAALVVALVPVPAFATTDINNTTVTAVGCVSTSDTCYVELSGYSGGYSGCTAPQLRFSVSGAGGRSVLALLTAAYLSGKSINATIAACYDSTYPELTWMKDH